jgi:hypothetical protein
MMVSSAYSIPLIFNYKRAIKYSDERLTLLNDLLERGATGRRVWVLLRCQRDSVELIVVFSKVQVLLYLSIFR